MRKRSFDYIFIDPMILNILKNSPSPIQALTISFWINEKSGKIISFNTIKHHLNFLVNKKKIIKIEKNGIFYYSLNKNFS